MGPAWESCTQVGPFILAGKVGVGPTTDRLTADCSTTELLPNMFYVTQSHL
jgi:hypothetical protein